MNYTVFENKETKARFITSYSEDDCNGWYNIIGHANSIEDAQAICNVVRQLNIDTFINQSKHWLTPELEKIIRQSLK